MKNILVTVIAGFLFCGNIYSQDRLLIGDKVAELNLPIHNRSGQPVKLSSYKGKVVIFVIWNTLKSSEERSQVYWPVLDQLQKKYDDKVQIFLTYGGFDVKEAETYFKRKSEELNISLPAIFNNQLSYELIGIKLGAGYAIWVDQQGYLKSFTTTNLVIEDNIRAALEYRSLKMRINEPVKTKGLDIGDQVPDFKISNILNYPHKFLQLSDLRGKLVILDFWSSYCASCIASWPKFMEIQEQFKDRIQIILVNWQDKNTVIKLTKGRREITGLDMSLPSVYSDTLLGKQLFPHSGVPHIVWINEDGKVVHITSTPELTAKNISAVLRKEKVHIAKKINNDEMIIANTLKPLFVKGNANWDREKLNVLWESFFMKGIRGIAPECGMHNDFKYHSGISVINRSIRDMYALAYTTPERLNSRFLKYLLPNRIELQVDDPEKYTGEADGNYDNYDNRYIYQLLASRAVHAEQLLKRMQADLKGNIGLDVRWEKRTKKCLVLYSTDTTLFSYKNGPRKSILSFTQPTELNKITIKDFVDHLKNTKYFYSPYPIIDETNFKGLIGGIKMEVDYENPEALDRALQKFGLRFTLQERKIDVLVLCEPEEYKFPYESEVTKDVFR